MANTVIQIKRSTVTTAPTAGSLSAAEPAYSYLSDKLFIGSSDGSQVIEIGGRFYINTAVRADQTANQSLFIANLAFDKANAANVLAFNGGGALLIANLAFDKANAANVLAFNTGLGANAFASATIAGANLSFQNTIAGANAAVGTGANNFASATIAGANTAVGNGANNFASATIAGANSAVGTGANNFASATIAGANTAVGNGANNYSNATFVKLTAAGQTITGNLAVTGSLTVSGNAYTIDSQTLRVSDPLIYLAGNNYVSDILDIGFVANYVSANSQNLHTGLFRDATIKEYYVFDSYNQEPNPNHIDTSANGFSLAVLNATLKTSNLILGGANAILTIASIGPGANAFASATIAGANSAVGTGANNFASATIAGANTAVGTGANNFASATIAGANLFFQNTIAGANSAVGTGANNFASATIAGANLFFQNTIAGANSAVGTGANNFASATIAGANLFFQNTIAGANSAVGTGANNFTIATLNGANTAVGAGANNYLIPIINAANTNAANGTYITTGIVRVSVGGTGVTTFANNGILFGNITGAVRVTAAGTEGNVLQVNAQGTPLFGMLDGGTF